MKWIEIKISGQPKKDDWYLAFDGIVYDRVLYNQGKWISQNKTYKSGNIMQNVGTREDLTKFITHYTTVELPTNLNERQSTTDHKQKVEKEALDIPVVSHLLKDFILYAVANHSDEHCGVLADMVNGYRSFNCG